MIRAHLRRPLFGLQRDLPWRIRLGEILGKILSCLAQSGIVWLLCHFLLAVKNSPLAAAVFQSIKIPFATYLPSFFIPYLPSVLVGFSFIYLSYYLYKIFYCDPVFGNKKNIHYPSYFLFSWLLPILVFSISLNAQALTLLAASRVSLMLTLLTSFYFLVLPPHKQTCKQLIKQCAFSLWWYAGLIFKQITFPVAIKPRALMLTAAVEPRVLPEPPVLPTHDNNPPPPSMGPPPARLAPVLAAGYEAYLKNQEEQRQSVQTTLLPRSRSPTPNNNFS